MLFVKIGIVFCMLSIVIGAFGAHSLKDMIGDKMDVFRTGVQYHIFHGLALILTGILSKTFGDIENIDVSIPGYLFILGIILFSGSLYLISIYKLPLGMIAPIGGLSFILGWIILFYKLM